MRAQTLLKSVPMVGDSVPKKGPNRLGNFLGNSDFPN